jgi:DHA1 family inner membrane transport protein
VGVESHRSDGGALRHEHAPGSSSSSPTETVTLVLITMATFAFATAITMLGPLLVDLARDLDVPLGQAGLLAAVTALPWALGAPFTGLLSDRLGRRPLIVLALVGVGIATIGAALTTSFAALLAARFAAGVFGAFGPASLMAATGDLFPPQRRGMAMGWLNAGFGLAAIVGVPLVGLVDGVFGWRWAFAATGACLVLLGGAVQLAFPLPPRAAQTSSLRQTYAAVLRAPFLGNVLGANLIERSVFNAGVLYLPSFLMLSYSLTASEVAPALALVAVGTIVGTSVGGWLGDRLPRARIFVVAQLAAGVVAVTLFGTQAGLVVSVLLGGLFGLSNASSRPAFLALGSELAPRHRGALLGLLSLTNQGGAVLGASLGGVAIGVGSYRGFALLLLTSAVAAAALAVPLALLAARSADPSDLKIEEGQTTRA